MKISIILPAYNEENLIEDAVREVVGVLEGLHPAHPYEIILVDDGSTDSTYEKMLILSKKFKNVVALRYSPNRGKGYAIRYGVNNSTGDLVIFYDSDLEIHPTSIIRVIKELLIGREIVVGSKYALGSSLRYSKIRKLLSLGYRMINRFLFGIRLRDTQAGIKGFKRGILEQLLNFYNAGINGYAFDIALIAAATELGIPIEEIPIKVRHDDKNSKIKLRSIVEMLIDSVKLRLVVTKSRRVLKKYRDKYRVPAVNAA
jgi:glycosyltransferase involved in cell wall biosynthesis